MGAELLLISAGFDAHADDPLAGLEWQDEDFAWLTGRCAIWPTGRGRVVSTVWRAAMIWMRWRPVGRGACGRAGGAGPMTDKPVETMSFEEAMAALEQVVGASWSGRSAAGGVHCAL
jgi:hypothetical protein